MSRPSSSIKAFSKSLANPLVRLGPAPGSTLKGWKATLISQHNQERVAAGVSLGLLIWAALPPHRAIIVESALLLVAACLLLDAVFAPARLNRLGSGAPALMLGLGLASVGSPWLAGAVLLLRIGLFAVLSRAPARKLWQTAASAAPALAAVLLSIWLGSGWPLWALIFVGATMLLSPEDSPKTRLRKALGEAVWGGALIWSAAQGPWLTLLALAALLAHSYLQEVTTEESLANRFQGQMDRAEGTLRTSQRRHEREKEKYQDFVTLQAMLDDFQGVALLADSNKAVAEALLDSARALEEAGQGGIVEGGPSGPQAIAATTGFSLEDFGALPRELSDGKILRSPDGLRVVFPLAKRVVFLWQRASAESDRLRDELLRHLLERAGLILRIQAQRRELADLLLQRTQALEDLARSQTQLVQTGKMAAVGQMAAGVAHELNSPLAAVQLQIELALRRLGKSDLDGVRESLETCERAGGRAQAIIKNLLTFSRLSDGRRVEVSPKDLVEQTLAMLEGHFQQAQVRCSVELPDLPPISVNPQDVQHVLTNIAVNAVDALKQRDSDRQLKVTGQAVQGQVQLELFNNGPAIESDHLDKLFEPFFTTKEAGHGTGLGLSIAYELATAQGGTLTARNGGSGGVSFTLTLPGV